MTTEAEDIVICPNCNQVVPNIADIRQGHMYSPILEREVGVIDIGFKCKLCGHVWGHEIEVDAQKEV